MTKLGGRSPEGDSGELPGDGLPWALLDGYFAGTAAPAERARVTTWIEGAPERRQEIEAIHQIWMRGAEGMSGTPRWDTAGALASLERRLAAARSGVSRAISEKARSQSHGSGLDVESATSRTLSDRAWRWQQLLGLAAAMVLGAGLGTAWRLARNASGVDALEEFSTSAHQRARVTLRDGTTITLGAESRVRIPPDFGKTERMLDLDGEGLFSVRHDAGHPFAIRTARTVVHDVGTTFDVLAYASDSIERVAVIEGQVSIGGASLASHDVGTIDVTGHITLHHNADVTRLLLWSDGGLVFADTPLSDVMRALRRNYEVHVTLRDSALGAQRVTATFVAGTPVDAVLHDITAIIGAKYRWLGQSVVIER